MRSGVRVIKKGSRAEIRRIVILWAWVVLGVTTGAAVYAYRHRYTDVDTKRDDDGGELVRR
ncbi:MAG: hypothetical protein KY455_10200 [Euryarchaeota archaeon]|nr:hypothetical protein [Euryarchaeota archaeon]